MFIPPNLYIDLACLSVCLFVCLYPINVKTAEPIGPNFFEGHHVTLGQELSMIKIKNLCLKVFYFCKNIQNFEVPRIFSNKFSKTTKLFHEIRELDFVFVLKCTQREHVHNLIRRWGAKRPKA